MLLKEYTDLENNLVEAGHNLYTLGYNKADKHRLEALEQIREEILNTFLWENETEENLNDSVRKCLEIIDKYTGADK